jgi:cysteinyl-tRNA synthetase
MHVGTVRIGGEKMAKSTGNLVFVADLIAKSSAAAVRTLLLDRPWHDAWDYEEQALRSAEDRLEALHRAAGRPGGSEAATDAVMTALAEGLDVPRALDLAVEEGGQAARDLTAVLGL